MRPDLRNITKTNCISMNQGTTPYYLHQVVLMKSETKQLLQRIAAVTAAIAAVLGGAYYGTKKLPPTFPTSTAEDSARVIILDAGHGECA